MAAPKAIRIICASALMFAPLASSLAQSPQAGADRPPPLFTRDDAYLGAFFVFSSIALAPADKAITSKFQEADFQSRGSVRRFAKGVEKIAVPGSVIIGTSMYVIGRLTGEHKLADLGLHGEEAIAAANVLNTGVKWTAGRARPYAVADSNARDFQFLRGWRKGREYSSFPSGHTMAAFAAAAALTSETARLWPGSQWYVGSAMYGGAATVGLARLYNNQHWASDVIIAAGIGTFAGNKVVRWNHRSARGNRLDRWLLSASIAPSAANGLKLAWSVMPTW